MADPKKKNTPKPKKSRTRPSKRQRVSAKGEPPTVSKKTVSNWVEYFDEWARENATPSAEAYLALSLETRTERIRTWIEDYFAAEARKRDDERRVLQLQLRSSDENMYRANENLTRARIEVITEYIAATIPIVNAEIDCGNLDAARRELDTVSELGELRESLASALHDVARYANTILTPVLDRFDRYERFGLTARVTELYRTNRIGPSEELASIAEALRVPCERLERAVQEHVGDAATDGPRKAAFRAVADVLNKDARTVERWRPHGLEDFFEEKVASDLKGRTEERNKPLPTGLLALRDIAEGGGSLSVLSRVLMPKK